MSKYGALYDIGEEYIINALKEPENIRSNISGFRQSLIFNKNDHYSSVRGIIQIYITVDKYFFTLVINLLTNKFAIMYSLDDFSELNDSVVFDYTNIPYDISEEWHFQLSTVKEFPFSYEFLLHLKSYVNYFENIIDVDHNIEVIREHHNIVPYPYR